MRYIPKNYLPTIKFQSRFIRPVDTDHENTINVQKMNDKKKLSREDWEKKYKGLLVNTKYIPNHEDYKSNVEQTKNYCLYLQWLLNHYLTDNQLAGLLHRFEGGTQSGWYVWLNADLMEAVMFAEKFPRFIRFAKRLLLSPHLQFYKNNQQQLELKVIKTVHINMIDKENINLWEAS